MEGKPAGATFGSLVTPVIEHADPEAPDLAAELRSRVAETQLDRWSVDATCKAVAEAMVPICA